MSVFSLMDAGFEVHEERPTFLEQWVAGTYVVAGIFPTDGTGLNIEQMKEQIPWLYATTRAHKRARWPKGICGYYLLPVYTAECFHPKVIEWVHSYHRYRWAIWHEPVLYATKANVAELRADYSLHGSAFRSHLTNLIDASLRTIARRFGHEFPRMINGLPAGAGVS
jgi:hypothetical protein